MLHLRLLLVLLFCAFAPTLAQATVVRFDTILGSFDVRLFDGATPLTANNFLGYVQRGDYTDNLIHRSIPGFIIQGGGWTFDGSAQVEPDDYPKVVSQAPVLNEPGISNIRGTLAMAKQEVDPNSATNQWFVNLAHNTANLDNQNEGFTAYAKVLGSGMAVVDAIADLPTFGFQGAWTNGPMRNYTTTDYNNFVPVDDDNLVIINSITIQDFADGDYTFDGNVDGADLALWQADYGRLNLVSGDFNDDFEIDAADLSIWTGGYGSNSGGYTDGDADGDRNIDGLDFLLWQRGNGSTVDVAADGNGNAQVDGFDFLMWQRSFDPAIAQIATSTIPEPSALTLLSIGMLFLARRTSRC